MGNDFLIKNKRILCISFILLLSCIVYFPFLSFSECAYVGDTGNEYIPFVGYIQESMIENYEIPLWIHHISSGMPFLAIGDKPVFYPILLFFLLFFKSFVAYNLMAVLHLILAGIGMYLLVHKMTKSAIASLISGIIFMLNNYSSNAFTGWYGWGIAFIPYLLYLILKTYESKKIEDIIIYSMLLAIGFALQFYSGSIFIFMYTFLLFGTFLAFKLIGKNFRARLTKSIIIGFIATIFTLGLIALIVLPNQEFSSKTNRAGDMTFEESAGHTINIFDFSTKKSAFTNLVKGCTGGGRCSSFGVVAFILLLFSIPSIKKKNVFFFWAVLILVILLATGSPLYYLLWKFIPPFDKMRNIARVSIIGVFAVSALAGFGYINLRLKVEKILKMTFNKKALFVSLLIALLLVDLLLFFGAFSRIGVKLDSIRTCNDHETKLMQDLSKEYSKEPFRVKFYNINGIGRSTQYATIPMGLDSVYGHYGGLWIPEYLNEYLGMALQKPSRMWGNINVRYLVSPENVSLEGFEFEKEYENCSECFREEINGPYLYENDFYLPRAFFSENAVLIAGEGKNALRAMYYVLMNDNLNLSESILIMEDDEDKLNNPAYLNRFKGMILATNNVDRFSLEQYNGRMFPDVLNGEKSIDERELDEFLSSLDGKIIELPVLEQTPNTINVDASYVSNGFVVYNEKMYMFPGWKVRKDNELIVDGYQDRMIRTNGIISSFYMGEGGLLKYEYKPKSFILGRNIALITLIIIIGFFIYYWRKK